MKKKNKKLLIICALLICVLIIFGVYCIYLNKSKNFKSIRKNMSNSIADSNMGRTEEGQLLFSGLSVFIEKYNGEIQISDITKELNKIVKSRIPKTYNIIKDYNDSELEIFFQNNQKSLKNMYGIQSSEEFINFAKKLIEQDIEVEKYYKLVALVDTFVADSDKEGYSCIEIELEYEDGSKFPFVFYVTKFTNLEPNYIISIK